jgi:hypothetical protein
MKVERRESVRAIPITPGLESAIHRAGAVLIDRDVWAGTNRAPLADAAFLDSLEHRLRWEPKRAGSLERDEELDWRSPQLEGPRLRWHRKGLPEARLWKAKSRFGYTQWAWSAAGCTPADSDFVVLSHDEAWRAVFAAAKMGGASVQGTAEARPDGSVLLLPIPVPTPEYRYAGLVARQTVREANLLGWAVDASSAATLCAWLSERLGISWEDQGGERSARPEFETLAPTDASAPTSSAPAGAHSLDERIAELRTVGPLLRSVGVYTYRDLLRTPPDSFRKLGGVGAKKRKLLDELFAEARRREDSHATVSQAAMELSSSKNQARFNYDGSTPGLVLGRLSKRICNVIDDHQLTTILALKDWHRTVDLLRVRNYGRGTHTKLGNLLERLEREGHEVLVFGGPTPLSITELGQRYLDHPEVMDRELLELRFVRGWTLERIGQHRGITRERVRQIAETDISDARPSWGPIARALLEPASLLLEGRGGILLTRALRVALGTPPDWAIDLACLLAGIDLFVDVIAGITTSLPREEFHLIRRDLRRVVGEEETLTPRIIQKALSDTGILVPVAELPEFSEILLYIRIDRDLAYPDRRSVQQLYIKALRDAGEAISAEEVARRVNAMDPSVEATPRNAVAHFSRVHTVYNYAVNQWIHVDHLPITGEELDALAQLCLPEIQAADGTAVSARLLLQRLVAKGEASPLLTPHVLRDALIHTGKVRGWRAGSEVAWLGADVKRTPIRAWLLQTAADLEQPFHVKELVHAVAASSGALPSSIEVAFHAITSEFISLGEGAYVSIKQAWPDESRFKTAVALVEKAVAEGGLRSADGPFVQVQGLEAEMSRFGPGMVWGLANFRPEVIRTRESGRFMWPASLGLGLWDAIARGFLDNLQVFRPQDLRDYLFKLGLRSEHVVYNLLKEGLVECFVQRVGMRWYIDARLPSERQIALLDAVEEIRQMALWSQDFVRESPLRAELNELRRRHGAFQI